MQLRNGSSYFRLGSHQHGPHFFQFLGFSLRFLLQICVFLFYVQAFLLVIDKTRTFSIFSLTLDKHQPKR